MVFKRNMFVLLSSFMILGFFFCIKDEKSVAYSNFPKYKSSYVNDYSGIISVIDSFSIDSVCRTLKRNYGITVVVCVIDSILSKDQSHTNPMIYASDLFNDWGIGSKKENDGLLLLISLKNRIVLMNTGYGIEEIIQDSACARIIKQGIVPYFKEQKYSIGILDALEEIRKKFLK